MTSRPARRTPSADPAGGRSLLTGGPTAPVGERVPDVGTGRLPRREPIAAVRRALHHVARSALSFALVGLIATFTLREVDVATVVDRVADMDGWALAILVALGVWNLVTYPLQWMAVVPGLSFGQGLTVAQGPTAVANTLPGGAAVAIAMSYVMLASWGFPRTTSTVGVLLSGVWNTFVKLAMPVVALALVAVHGTAGAGRVTAALGGVGILVLAVVVFSFMLRREDRAAVVGRVAGAVASRALRAVGRPPVVGWDAATTGFRARTIGLLEQRWVRITGTTVVVHLSLFVLLLAALRAVGVGQAEGAWAEVLAVFAFARLATAIPLTPGGLGVAEAVLLAGLVGAGADTDEVAAGVFLYRTLTWFLPIPVGVVTYVLWRRWCRTAGPLRPAATGPA